MCKYRILLILHILFVLEERHMRIIIDTEKGVFIVPNTFKATLKKQNDILEKAGVDKDKLWTERKFIESAIKDAFERPILTTEQAKEWNPDFEKQVAEK